MLNEYKKIAKPLGIAEHKIDRWWKELNPKEKEGMKRMAAVGLGRAGIAAAIAYEPQALPLAFVPTNLYIQRFRIKNAIEKLHHIQFRKKDEKLRSMT